MRNKALAALLMLAAAALCMSHLRVPYNTAAWQITSSQAALRAGETMPYDMPDGDIDPNTADAKTLEGLSGVGPAMAQAIIDEREKNGPLYYPEDLINIRGIGRKTMQRMLERLKLP